jgi:hypothetical protein
MRVQDNTDGSSRGLVVTYRGQKGGRVYHIPYDLTETQATLVVDRWHRFVKTRQGINDPYFSQPRFGGEGAELQKLVRVKFVHEGYVGPLSKYDELVGMVIEDILQALKDGTLLHYVEKEEFDGTVADYSYPGWEDDVEESDASDKEN